MQAIKYDSRDRLRGAHSFSFSRVPDNKSDTERVTIDQDDLYETRNVKSALDEKASNFRIESIAASCCSCESFFIRFPDLAGYRNESAPFTE